MFSIGGGIGGLFITDGSFAGTHLLIQAAYPTGVAILPPAAAAGAADAAPPCFLPGTRILTDQGEIPVEMLRPGDRVRSAFGGWRTLCWVGRGQAIVGRDAAHPARPVIIRAGALGAGVPARDLRVTQGHCLHFPAEDADDDGRGALVPAVLLVNGTSILLDPATGPVAYLHLAVDGHDAVLADGAPCETWRDDGTRDDGGGLRFETPPPPGLATGPPCAPKLAFGPRAQAIWRRLRSRAGCADIAGDADPGLHLHADGVPVAPEFRHGDCFRFTLPRRPRLLAIASRAAVPATAGLTPDLRRRGVGIARITMAQAGHRTDLPFTDPALIDGFHPIDPSEGRRWTNGNGLIAIASLGLGRGPMRVQIDAIGLPRYPS